MIERSRNLSRLNETEKSTVKPDCYDVKIFLRNLAVKSILFATNVCKKISAGELETMLNLREIN